ncbi:MAG: tetratricopeptide repeat protein [Planctomycetota bacterium]|nr:tetratricopeptide repeat protein [Planctomycetota bacterium]
MPEKEFQDKVKPAFELLAKDAPSPWKERGQIGLVRLRAVNAAAIEDCAKELDRMIARWAVDKNEVAIDGAYYLGGIQERLNRMEQARRSYRFAIDMLAYLENYLQKDFYSGVISRKRLDSALANLQPKPPDPDQPQALFEQARAAQKEKQYAKARGLFEKVIAGWPGHPLTHQSGYRIAECFLEEGSIRAAQESLRAFLASAPLGPWRGQAHHLFGNILLLREFNPPLAATHFAAALTPKGFKPWWERQDAKGESAGNTPPVPAGYIAEDEPPDPTWKDAWPDAHIALGVLNYFYGRHENAAKHLERSAQLRPDPTFGVLGGMTVLSEMARDKEDPLPRIYLQQGDPRSQFVLFYASALVEGWSCREAIALYDRVLKNEFKGATQEQRAYALYGTAKSYFFMGLEERPKAIELYGKFLEPPWNRSQIAPRAILGLACAYCADGDSPTGIKYLDYIIERFPGSEWREWALYQRAFASYVFDDPDTALAWYAKFLREYPNHRWEEKAKVFIARLEARKKQKQDGQQKQE